MWRENTRKKIPTSTCSKTVFSDINRFVEALTISVKSFSNKIILLIKQTDRKMQGQKVKY